MNINYVLSPYPTLYENMVAKIYEASSPDAEVQSFTIVERNGAGVPTPGAGHQVPVTISFNGCDRVTHVVRLFTASATLLHEYDREPTEDTVTVFDPIYFQVGDGGTYTPTAGSSFVNNPAFSGLTAAEVSISQEGFGFLLPGIDYTLTGTAVTLLTTLFESGQRWYIFKKPSVVATPVNDSVVGKGFGGFVDIVANTNYIVGHLRKLIRFSGTGNYTFPAGSYPVGYIHSFNNFGTLGSTPQINFNNATLLYNGTPKSSMVIPFGSTFAVTFDGTNWNCILNDIKGSTSAPVSGDIVGQGSYPIGNLPSTDNIFTVTHGLALGYAYKVLGSIVSSGTHSNDNAVSWAVREFTTNSFKITLEELHPETQNISFEYILVKT